MAWTNLSDVLPDVAPILEANSVALCLLDAQGQMVYANTSYKRMLQRKGSEAATDLKVIEKNGQVVGTVVIHHDLSEVNRLRRELDRLNQKLRSVQVKYTFQDIIGNDPALVHTVKTAKGAALTPATVLIRGETGTGKELFAHAIHNSSERRYEKLVKVNCSAIPEEILESELFGYSGGAFTGANRDGKRGLFFEAHKGTLFLDEIGDISMRMQAKLLRVLQEKEIMLVGGTESIPVDVRIICATNKSLEDMIRLNKFRSDLYYRINVFPLVIPPLRKRLNDIGPILEYLLNKYNYLYNRNVRGIAPGVIRLLKLREWPGNVRELENILSRAMINMEENRGFLSEKEIGPILDADGSSQCSATPPAETLASESFDGLPGSLKEALQDTERRFILQALRRSSGDKNRTAHELGIPLRTLYYKCRKLGI